MTSQTNVSIFAIAALATFCITAPISAQAQDLDIQCEGLFTTCVQSDGTEIADAINENATDIDANAQAAATAQETANGAVEVNTTQQGEIDANELAAATAQETADGAVEVNTTQQGQIDANELAAATAQETADGAVEVNTTQQGQIDANEQAAATAQETVDGAVAVNVTQQTEIDANTAGVAQNVTNIQTNTSAIATNAASIQTNAENIATNTGNIATNAADIVDLQNDLSDLRTDLNQGLAMANAMEVFAPDPGSNFRLNVGTGYHDGETAFGVTASGRVGAAGGTIVYLGVAGSQDTAAGKAGVSFQW